MPRGSTIINSVAQVVQNPIDCSFDVREAVDALRAVQTSANGATRREIAFSELAIDAFSTEPPFGHTFRFPANIVSLQAIIIDRGKRQYEAADWRRVDGIVTLERDEIAEGKKQEQTGGRARPSRYRGMKC